MAVHGIGSNWRVWRGILPALEAEHDVLAVDLPGFGESPVECARGDFSIMGHADALERELDEQGIESPHVVGNSLGGWIALELGRRGRARSVVAISPAGAWSEGEQRYSRAMLRSQRRAARALVPFTGPVSRSPVLRTLSTSLVSARPWRIPPHELEYAFLALAGAPGWEPTLEWVEGHSLERPEEIETPVRVLWGSRDRLLFPRQGPPLVERMPDAELVPLRGLGHVPMWDDPEETGRAVLEFTRARTSGAVPAAA